MDAFRFGSVTDDAFRPQSPTGDWSQKRLRAVIWLTLVFWLSYFLSQAGSAVLAEKPHVTAIASMRILTTLVGIAFCYALHLLLRQPVLSSTGKRLVALAIIVPIVAEMFTWTTILTVGTVDPQYSEQSFTWSRELRNVALYTWLFLAWSGLYLAISYSFDVQEEQQRTAELQEQAHAAQLRALHSQINPHFLFNSLNSVSALMLDGQVALADDMVTKLAHFMRLGLAADPTAKVPLWTEIDLQRTYLAIEQLRYQDLEVAIAVPPDLEDALVPALILQPIVENAVKYGVAGAPPPARIEIEARRETDRLRIRITDSGNGAPPKAVSTGIGLTNVRERLRLIYGKRRGLLSAGKLTDGSFRVELSLPLELT